MTRRGFTLIEVVIAAMILAIMAAATVPTVVGFIDRQRAQTTADILSDLSNAITSTNGFFAVVRTNATTGMYPGKLSELNNQLVASNAQMRNSCGGSGPSIANAFNATATNNWISRAPFYASVITPGQGLNSPLGILADSMQRVPAAASATQTNYLEIRIPNVTREDAANLDQIMDGTTNADSANGAIRWSSLAANGTVEVHYRFTISNHC